jgi:small subunit ribosomal protein S21
MRRFPVIPYDFFIDEAWMIKVKARINESLEQLLKRFKKACEKEGLIRDMKRTAFYEKPSEIRRRKERQLVRRILKESKAE